jgi:hypothetical protein
MVQFGDCQIDLPQKIRLIAVRRIEPGNLLSVGRSLTVLSGSNGLTWIIGNQETGTRAATEALPTSIFIEI